jgi:two-component system alkaline phosphatase synthesis response regulator PhoP
VSGGAARATRRILVVEDEAALRLALSDRLRGEGYEVEVAADGEQGFQRAREGSFDLVLLDVMLPGRSGFDLCRDLRREGVDTPILMLTARGEVLDRVLGLKLGADDYLVKPFEAAELLARIEALLRRVQPDTEGGSFAFGDVRVDFRRVEVTRKGDPVELSALEFRLLRYLVEHKGELLTRDRLLDEVWGYSADVYSRTVDQHVATLRRKIETDPRRPRHVVTVHGLGYRFVP